MADRMDPAHEPVLGRCLSSVETLSFREHLCLRFRCRTRTRDFPSRGSHSMTPRLVAMSIIFGIILIGAITGIYAGFRRQMNLEQWTVGGRGFGLILVWLLMAGEVYTTFAFLGASGWAYSRGAPTFYVIAYLTLA